MPMTCLLTSLGRSPWIVAEASLTAATPYSEVRVITSSSPHIETEALEKFFAGRTQSRLRIFRVPGLTDLNEQAEQDAFEDALYPWYMEAVQTGASPDVCISGGFKSMSGTLQKAAHLLGAREVFHVLADENPDTEEKVLGAVAKGRVRRISMGPEPGWASLRRWACASKSAGDARQGIHAQLQTMRKTMETPAAVLDHESLPFRDLALLTPDMGQWLLEPLDGAKDGDWITALPKTELHCHLGGFATHGPDLAAVRAAAANPSGLKPVGEPDLPEGWPKPEAPVPLNDYMRLGDGNGSTLLNDPGCLREQVRRLYQYLVRERILYAEIRCSPANYARDGKTALEILETIQAAFEECRREPLAGNLPAPQVNLLVIVTRRESGDLSSVARHLALAVAASGQQRDCRVVGVDLAGFEKKETRPIYFQTDFHIAHRCGLAVTAHAGENDDVESIWQAVYKLSARRLGHALRLGDSSDLLRVARDRGIGLEMCPYANYQIHGYAPMSGKTHYPLLGFLRHGLKVSVNTDNPGISAAGLGDNLRFLADLCPGITRMELLQCIRNGFDTAFLEPAERARLLDHASTAVFHACRQHAIT